MNKPTAQELIRGIASNIGGLIAETKDRETTDLLNQLMILLFKIQERFEEGERL